MSKVPKVKKRIGAFLIEEEGKIDKNLLFKTGIISSTALLSMILSSEDAFARVSGSGHSSSPAPAKHSEAVHANSLSLNCDSKATCTGSHSHSITNK